MKIQCNCGTKYAFEITSDMAANPVRFVCQNCGADSSAVVNQIIQQEFAAAAMESAPPPASVAMAAPVAAPPMLEPPIAFAPRIQVKLHTAAPAASSASVSPESAAPQMCRKHPGHFAAEQCRVCGKPVCPQCMALFGYVCSSFCKSEAEQRGIDVPVYQNQAALVGARQSKKLGLMIGGTFAAGALFIGTYFWYQLIGSHPHVVFSQKFTTPAYGGSGKLVGQQAVLLHGAHLARYDLKGKKEIWGVDLIDVNQLATEAEQDIVDQNAMIENWKKNRTADDVMAPSRSSKEEFLQRRIAGAQSKFALHVLGENIWLRSGDKLVQYDWASGKPGREVALKGYVERMLPAKDSLLIFAQTQTGEELTKLDLKSGETQTQQLAVRAPIAKTFSRSNRVAIARAGLGQTNKLAGSASAKTNAFAALRGTPANPALKGYKVEQPVPIQVRIAAPAIVATTIRNKQIDKALEDDDERAIDFAFDPSRKQWINDGGSLVEFSVKLLESKTIERQAMKAPPKKSALEGDVNQAATAAIVNEMMNESQRELTGGVEKEDVSRYEVTIKHSGADATETKLEVVGPAQFFPLKTVDLLVAGKTLIVLDKASKKLWESKLNYAIAGGFDYAGWGGDLSATAAAPAVERENVLYFFDQGVLTCFELATGNARWRQPTVGVTKILLDDQGTLYVDTTTGSAENLKYSQQHDVTRKSYPVILKIDPKSGKALWRSEQNGRLSHVFGKYIYTMEWNGGDDDEAPSAYKIGIEIPPHIRIRRLSASNGKPLWEYYQKHAPINVDIQDKTIQLVFKKEMQVLKFIAL